MKKNIYKLLTVLAVFCILINNTAFSLANTEQEDFSLANNEQETFTHSSETVYTSLESECIVEEEGEKECVKDSTPQSHDDIDETSLETDSDMNELNEYIEESGEYVTNDVHQSTEVEEAEVSQWEETEDTKEEQSLLPSRSMRAMTQINSSTVIVSNYAELSDALSKDNGYTYIYLAGNITQGNTQTGITIHSSKSSVIIDGLAPNATQRAVFTQRISTNRTHTIKISSGNTVTKSVTMRNINILGKNPFGFVSADDSVLGLALSYENIIYRGPLLTYNHHGSAHYQGGKISIINVKDINADKAAETASVRLSGLVLLSNTSQINPMFRLTGTSTSMTFSTGASVKVTESGYFINADKSSPYITLEDGSSLSCIGTAHGFMYSAQSLEKVFIGQGASLSISQTKSNHSFGTLRIKSSLQMEPGSSLMIDRTDGGAAIQFISAKAAAVFNSPQRVKLYSPSGLIKFQQTGKLKIKTDAVNIWDHSAGFINDSISNVPTSSWNKGGGESLVIDSSFSDGRQTVTSNLTDNDPTADLTALNFMPSSFQMLAFGSFNLDIDTVYENSSIISGNTEADSKIKVNNLTQGNALIAQGDAISTTYSLPINGQLAPEDILSVISYNDYLRKMEKTSVTEAPGGILEFIYVPDSINFGSAEITGQQEAISAANSWHIEIKDSRKNSRWSLMASISGPLTGESRNGTHILTDALVFVNEHGDTTVLSSSIQTLIYAGSGDATLSWSNGSGILLAANHGEIMSDVKYKTVIEWSLQDAP